MREFFSGELDPTDKLCGNCIHWCSFEEDYEDEEEPSDIGRCSGNKEKDYSNINDTCQYFKNDKE